MASDLDRLQSEFYEGPCRSAITEPPDDGVIVVDDLAGPGVRRRPA